MKNSKVVVPTKQRWFILFLIFITVVICYLDRANISVVAPSLQGELSISPITLGYIFSTFGWAYCIFQVPTGWLADKIGSKRIFILAILLWSIATFMQGYIGSVMILIALRILIGIFEAPTFSIINKFVTGWFPERERTTAFGIFTSAEFVGLAFLTPLLMWIEITFSWHWVFYLTGIIGVIWGIVLWRWLCTPDKSQANRAELDYISQGGGLVNIEKEKVTITKNDIKQLFNRKLVGMYLTQFSINTTLWFALSWMPTYLITERHLSFMKAGFMTSVPFVGSFIGVILAGMLSDYFIKKGKSIGFSRKLPIIVGLILACSISLANFTNSTSMIVMFMFICYFGNGFASNTWAIVSNVSPQKILGMAGGMFNMCGNIGGVVVAIVFGYFAAAHNYGGGLTYIAIIALVALFSILFLVGNVDPLSKKKP